MIKAIGKPYPFQSEAIAFHRSKPYTINLYDMGLGKSLISLHSLVGLKSVLIVCPAYLRQNWKDEIAKWTTGGEFTVISYEGLKSLKIYKYDGVLADEAQYLKNKDAQRTRRFFSLIFNHSPKKLILLTGTPIKNRVTDFWALLKIVLQTKMPYEYWAYCNRFANRSEVRLGQRKIVKFEGLRNAKELSDLVKTCAIRKRTKDVLDLPEQVYKNIILKDSCDEKLLTKVKQYLMENNLEKNMASFKLVNALDKVKATIELVDTLLEQGQSVVVFTDHVKPCELLASHFKVNPIHGSSRADRALEVTKFNQGVTRVIVATIQSLNTGVTLTTANSMVFNDFNYVPSEMEQAEKRIHRIGQKSTCFYYYIYSSKLDYYINQMLKNKALIANEVLKEIK